MLVSLSNTSTWPHFTIITYAYAVTLSCIPLTRHDSFTDQLLMTEFMPVISHVS